MLRGDGHARQGEGEVAGLSRTFDASRVGAKLISSRAMQNQVTEASSTDEEPKKLSNAGKAELKQEATKTAKGAGAMAGAGVAGHFVLLFLSLALWAGLSIMRVAAA